MSRSLRRVLTLAAGAVTVLASGPGITAQAGVDEKFGAINHIVVIYEENHSFDNLYGNWEGVNGRSGATAANTTQVQQDNTTAYSCLPQNDVNLPPCISPNAPFGIEQYIPASAQTCPQPGAFFPHGAPAGPGNLSRGCPPDIGHRRYPGH